MITRELLFSRLAAISAGATAAIGAEVLAFATQSAGLVTATGTEIRQMEPWVAMALLLLGVGLATLMAWRESRWARRVAAGVALVVLAASLTSMALHLIQAVPPP